jgi:hypothetical protein
MNAQIKAAAKADTPASEPEIRPEIVSKLADALSRAQGEFPAIVKDKTAKVKSDKGSYEYQYADLASVIDAVRGPLAKHGLAYTQLIKLREDGRSILLTRLMHVSGESEEAEWALPTGSPQQVGSALTYARRYCLSAMLGVAAEIDDDDGQAGQDATPAPRPAPKQETRAPAQQQAAPQTNGQANGKPEHRPFALIDGEGVEHTFAKGADYLAGIEKAFQEAADKIGFWDSNVGHFQSWQAKLIKVGTDPKALAEFSRVGKEIADTVFLLISQKGA